MKSFGIIAASALFGAIANAAPLNKRDVVWVTEIETDVVTVPVTMTVWAGAEETTVAAATTTTESRHGHQFFHSKAPKASTTSTAVPAASTTTSSSVYVAPTPSSTSVYVEPTPSTTSVYIEPTPSTTAVYVAPTTSSTPVYVAPTTSSVYVAPTIETTSAYVAPTIESTSVYVAPTTSTTSSAPAATTSSSSSGSSSGMAASGTEYTGDLTWYQVGLGSCGIDSTSDEAIVAISHTIFDDPQYATANPNLNPLCGKTVSIKGKDGSTYKAKVVDRCVGCAAADLDLSEGFFNTVTSNGDGRVPEMSWSWE
ncbi:hypothetical protein E4T47_00587 [Aureobasidium subglaciale]|nr:hypothetical protein E4T43_01225 [Aureobasidium subglaciale]KAI5276366.1 hypothetical protein E4T47_00587 [Aureobasidium subglaciale]